MKYDTDIINNNIIHELIDDGYLEISGDMLRCKKEYIYLLNYILDKIIGSDLC